MVNLADVASCIFPKMTSRWINVRESFKEVRDAVRTAIETVGYQPNRMAQALVTNRHYVIEFWF